MDAASAKELAAAMAILASLVDTLGAGGVLGLMVGSPLLMVVTFSLQGWVSTRRQQSILETYQKDALTRSDELACLSEKNRQAIFDLWERHRTETHQTLNQMKDSLGQLARFYENNVILVKNYEQMAKGLNDLVAVNTRSVERLTVQVETFFKVRVENK